MNGCKAVLWDMDGTLVNSEELHWISWRNTMAKEGIVITREQFLSTFGQRNDSIIPSWLGSAATGERIERIAQAKEEILSSLGATSRHCTRTRGCNLVGEAPKARMAASNRLGSAARQH